MKAEDGGDFDSTFWRAARSLHFDKEVEIAILIRIPSGVAPKEDDSSGVKPLNDRAGHGSNRVFVNHPYFPLLRSLSDSADSKVSHLHRHVANLHRLCPPAFVL